MACGGRAARFRLRPAPLPFRRRREELLDTAVVAVAADNSKPASELRPEDWELMPLMEIVEE